MGALTGEAALITGGTSGTGHTLRPGGDTDSHHDLVRFVWPATPS